MMNHQGKAYLTTHEVCQLWDKSIEAVRQKIYRKEIVPIRAEGSKRLMFPAGQINEYYPKKRGLPAMEACETFRKEEFFLETQVCRSLSVSLTHLRKLIKTGRIKAFCSVEGKIYIPESAIGEYMGVKGDEFANTL